VTQKGFLTPPNCEHLQLVVSHSQDDKIDGHGDLGVRIMGGGHGPSITSLRQFDDYNGIALSSY
jgi:hypothetical protein